MTSFREVEVRSAPFFKEVRLILDRTAVVDSSKDWFDHEKYRREHLPRLQAIKPPSHLIRFKKAEGAPDNVIDLEAKEAPPATKKPLLVPERRQQSQKQSVR